MGQYIDKNAVVAEIERYKNKADERLKIKGRTLAEDCKDSALQNLCGNLLYFIDTLEVKEVDLDEEADNLWGALSSDVRFSIYYNDYYKIAKHFFELGLSAGNSVDNKAQKGE